jgi:hypothetical protein
LRLGFLRVRGSELEPFGPFDVVGWGLCFDIRRFLGISRQSFYWIIFSSENVTYEEMEERWFLIFR